MSEKSSAILLTGSARRHKFVSNVLAEHFDLRGIVSGIKDNEESKETTPYEEQRIISQHFKNRDAAEKKHLGNNAFPSTIEVLEIPWGSMNCAEVCDWVMDHSPKVILLYGSCIIKEPILSEFTEKVINLHLGLSPYYRGSATNFWPLVENRPECVGATIHLATLDVDAGPILAQVRPPVEQGDRAHDLGSKTIIAGANVMAEATKKYLSGRLDPVPQDLTDGKVFKSRDFSAKAVQMLWKNFENGMIERYLENKTERDQAYPIISLD